MTREDIIRWARQSIVCNDAEVVALTLSGLKGFAFLVAEAERRECCKIVTGLCISDNNAEEINKAIRERGKK